MSKVSEAKCKRRSYFTKKNGFKSLYPYFNIHMSRLLNLQQMTPKRMKIDMMHDMTITSVWIQRVSIWHATMCLHRPTMKQ